MRRRTFLTTTALGGTALAARAYWPTPPQAATPPPASPATRYQPVGNGIATQNGPYFGNRPLYGANRPSLVLAGDRPVLRYLDKPFPGGSLLVAFARQGVARWLHDFASVEGVYQAGQLRWTLRDPAFAGLTLVLEALALADANGFVAKLTGQGISEGDELIALYGGLMAFSDDNLFWLADPGLHPVVAAAKPTTSHQGSYYIAGLNELTQPFTPANCASNQVALGEGTFTITGAPSGQPARRLTVHGWCSAGSLLRVADAADWASPIRFSQSSAAAQPALCARSPAPPRGGAAYWVIETVSTADPVAARSDAALAEKFDNAQKRLDARHRWVSLQTPDAFLNASLPALLAAMDACWYPPVFVHGGMSWNIPFPGWRMMYGPTCLGWHERVRAEAVHYLNSQRTQPGGDTARADPERRLSLQATDTRFYGQGRIQQDQLFYNMQEVFFDQLIHAWRWTGDAALEARLLPALELHLAWLRDCFDPDDDGLYESYLNVWASDSLWYNGGGTAQSTAYAYRGHRAAAELCQRAGQVPRAEQHAHRANRIRQSLVQQLWIPDRGYLAEYREATHHRRRHDDACLYTIFLPIDAELMEPLEVVQMLDYTEWGLERVAQAAGGEQCFTSNFVPLIWSVRELDTADTLHLALAYYQAGLGRQGWKLLEGAYKGSMFDSVVPGGIICEPVGKKYTSTDFGESVSMVARVLIEGLFGCQFDRPNGRVTLRPQLPRHWPAATLETPDFSLHFSRQNGRDTYQITLKTPLDVVVYLPVYAPSTPVVTCPDAAFTWTLQPGYGQGMVQGLLKYATSLAVTISEEARFQPAEYSYHGASAGERLSLGVPSGTLTQFDDPQGVLLQGQIRNGKLTGTVTEGVAGRHLVRVRVESNGLAWWHLFKLTVRDRRAEMARQQSLIPLRIRNPWQPIALRDHLNADLRGVYQQRYESPRPATTSAQLGVDGFSPWTYSFWKIDPPALTFSNVARPLERGELITSPAGIPFRVENGANNCCFTSLWDNWPDKAVIPIQRQGSEVALLVAGTTNPMQTRIANGVLRLVYADDTQDVIELVHPTNYWSVDGIYDYETDGFALPTPPPTTLQLGDHCRAVIVTRRLKPGITLRTIELETLSTEVIIGLLAVSIR